MTRVRLVVLVAVVVVLLATGAWWWSGGGRSGADPQSAARTALPDLTPASGPPTLESLETVAPAPGQVVQAAGPFDDRFRLSGLRFDGRTLTGTATVTSDVSEILELEAVAGFYDRDGRLLGTARDVYHLDESAGGHAEHEGTPDERHPIRITVPAPLRGQAVAAAVGIPVLVNE